MLRYTLRRVGLLVVVLLGVSVLSFSMLHLIPGDPAIIMAGVDASPETLARIRSDYGLDEPLPLQYVHYVSRLVRGDLGTSFQTRDPVFQTLSGRLQFTLQLALLSVALSLVIGIGAGVVAATHQNTWLDSAIMVTALAGISVPSFWLGLLLLQVFAGSLRWLPAGGSGTPQHLILPAFVLGTSGAAVVGRMTRASMLDVIRQDFIRTLRANGIPERLVVYRHALRNALNPVLTVIGLEFGFMLAGTVIVETVFSLPGIGRLLISAISNRDYPVIQGGMLLLGTLFVLVNLLTDLAYAAVNPRIRY